MGYDILHMKTNICSYYKEPYGKEEIIYWMKT